MKQILALIGIMILSSAVAFADGKQSFATRCASCHGELGLADGPVGKALPPGTVTNLVTGPFKYATDAAKAKELIQKGGAALQLNAMMPAAPGIDEAELASLVEFVISLRK